jgi:hypothetical protein
VLELAIDVPRADEGRVELFDVAGRALWSVPFRTSGPRSLTFAIGRTDIALMAGVVFARLRAVSGRSLRTRTVVVP